MNTKNTKNTKTPAKVIPTAATIAAIRDPETKAAALHIKEELAKGAESAKAVALELGKVLISKGYEKAGYKSVGAFATGLFGIKESQAQAWAKTAAVMYLNTPERKKLAERFPLSNLAPLAHLPDEKVDEVLSSMTGKETQIDIRERVKAEQEPTTKVEKMTRWTAYHISGNSVRAKTEPHGILSEESKSFQVWKIALPEKPEEHPGFALGIKSPTDFTVYVFAKLSKPKSGKVKTRKMTPEDERRLYEELKAKFEK